MKWKDYEGYLRDDGGRAMSKRPRQKNDCTVRAVAIATATDYDTVYDLFAKEGRKCSQGFHLQKWLPKVGVVFGHQVTKISFPAEKGKPRMSIRQFKEEYGVGTYILRVSKHVFAVWDGWEYDIGMNRQDKCVYTAFEFTPIEYVGK